MLVGVGISVQSNRLKISITWDCKDGEKILIASQRIELSYAPRKSTKDSRKISSGILISRSRRTEARTGKAILTGKKPLTRKPCESIVPKTGKVGVWMHT